MAGYRNRIRTNFSKLLTMLLLAAASTTALAITRDFEPPHQGLRTSAALLETVIFQVGAIHGFCPVVDNSQPLTAEYPTYFTMTRCYATMEGLDSRVMIDSVESIIANFNNAYPNASGFIVREPWDRTELGYYTASFMNADLRASVAIGFHTNGVIIVTYMGIKSGDYWP